MIIFRNFLCSSCGFDLDQEAFNQIQSGFMDVCLCKARVVTVSFRGKKKKR